MSSAVEKPEEPAQAAPPEEALEPREAALAEIKAAMQVANEVANEARQRANALLRRYVDVEDGAHSARRRKGRGIVLTDGTHIFGIETVN
jgi:hypothetical protein